MGDVTGFQGKRAPAAGLHLTWREVSWDHDRWPHFSPQELACRCGGHFCAGEYFHNPEFLDALEAWRCRVGAPFRVTSGRRCARHNGAVHGARLSQHTVAIAADIALDDHDPVRLATIAAGAGFRGLGFGPTFVHADMRPKRTGFHYPGAQTVWTKRFGFDPVDRFTRTGRLQ